MLLTLLLLSSPTVDEVRFPLAGGERGTAERGMLEVPLVRGDPESATIQVEYYRFPTEAEERDRPPIFILRGGPSFRGLGPQLRSKGFYEQSILPFARIADVVVVGQRGIGSSTPDTVCGSYAREDLTQPVDLVERASRLAEACRACREKWEAEGLDLSGFNVLEAAEDVIAVADHLGYGKITLTGSSFGSHWAMAILRKHEDRIARAVLSGIEGPDSTYDMPSHVLNALSKIAAAADADPSLTEYIPEGGLLAAFEGLVERAEEEPIHFTDGVDVLIDGNRMRELALGITARVKSRRGLRTWPADIIKLLDGDFEHAARWLAMRNFLPALQTASYFQLDCGSGISKERLEELLADPAARIVGPLGAFYQATCPAWDADLGEDFRAGFKTDVPTVLVHGTWDTSTPFENALEVLPYFTNGMLVVVEGGSHGAMGEARVTSPPFRAAITHFLETGEMEGIPDRIELPGVIWTIPE